LATNTDGELLKMAMNAKQRQKKLEKKNKKRKLIRKSLGAGLLLRDKA